MSQTKKAWYEITVALLTGISMICSIALSMLDVSKDIVVISSLPWIVGVFLYTITNIMSLKDNESGIPQISLLFSIIFTEGVFLLADIITTGNIILSPNFVFGVLFYYGFNYSMKLVYGKKNKEVEAK